MRHIIWSELAMSDFRKALLYLVEVNVTAADNLNTKLQHVLQQIADNPFLYKKGRVAGTREAIVTHRYIVIYRILDNQHVDIVRLMHTARKYP